MSAVQLDPPPMGESACCGVYTPPCCAAPRVLDCQERRGAVVVHRHACDECGATLNMYQVHAAHGLHPRGPYPFPPVTVTGAAGPDWTAMRRQDFDTAEPLTLLDVAGLRRPSKPVQDTLC